MCLAASLISRVLAIARLSSDCIGSIYIVYCWVMHIHLVTVTWHLGNYQRVFFFTTNRIQHFVFIFYVFNIRRIFRKA